MSYPSKLKTALNIRNAITAELRKDGNAYKSRDLHEEAAKLAHQHGVLFPHEALKILLEQLTCAPDLLTDEQYAKYYPEDKAVNYITIKTSKHTLTGVGVKRVPMAGEYVKHGEAVYRVARVMFEAEGEAICLAVMEKLHPFRNYADG